MNNDCFNRPNAIAYIKGGREAPYLYGEVKFHQKCGSVLAVANLYGLPKESKSGFFALHIHEGGDCSGDDFSGTGGHYNPTDAQHPTHAGDLPPLLLCNGGAYLAVKTDRFCVQDIIGRTIAIHSGSDDFNSQPAGNAGTKIACGEIKRAVYPRRKG